MSLAGGEPTLVAAQHSRSATACVYVLDTDVPATSAVRAALEAEGLSVRVVSNAQSLVRAIERGSAGCVLVGRYPAAADLPSDLARRGITLPIVVVSERGDVDLVRTAFRRGVFDFLQKPVDRNELLRAVRRALERDQVNRDARERAGLIQKRLGRLSIREQQIMVMVCEGYRNREIAALVGISPRTVEVHKAHLMEKLKVRTLVELMRVREKGIAMAAAKRTPGTPDGADG